MKILKRLFLLMIVFVSLSQNQVFAAKPIKVLAIGNSFSVDAAEAFLDDIAKEANVNMIIGNCNLGGCSLQRHWGIAKGDSALYAFRKITNGDSILLYNQTLKQCLQAEDWDYVTLQQVSHFAGIEASYFPYITDIMQFVRENSKNKKVKFALHQTWAYAANATHAGFKNYNNDQLQMYAAVTITTKKIADKTNIKMIIPSGTAIQNGRTTDIGDNFCRDGFHLSLDLGRYAAACVWYETLTKKSILNTTFKPKTVSEVDAIKVRHAAHWAVKSPFVITPFYY